MKILLGTAAAVAFCFSLFFCIPFDTSASEQASADGAPARIANYDIRTDRSDAAREAVSSFREEAGGGVVRSEPSAYERAGRGSHIELSPTLGVPEVIAPPNAGEFLAASSRRSRAAVLLDFVKDNPGLFGKDVAAQLVKTADYTNPDGVLSFVHYEQLIAGVPVFQGEVKAGFSKRNEMFRVINNLAPGISDASLSRDFGSPEVAVSNAAAHIGISIEASALKRAKETQNGLIFERGTLPDAVTAEKFYFPIEPGVARAAWRVLVWTTGDAFYVIVDANDGTMLWRKNITENQAAPATYNVYGNTTSLLKLADSPAPFTPGPNGPFGTQAPLIPRTDCTLVGNEAPYTFNDLGWIPDGGLDVRTPANPNITDGNNVEAGIDRDGTQGVDNNGWAVGNPVRVFSYSYNPAPGNPEPGENPLPPAPQPYPPTAFQQGVTAHAFYTANRWHDEMYRFGFTEQARNFQHHNFGRGGSEGDRISFEVQDSSGTNGATFAVPADGGRPRLQLLMWTGGTPDRDATVDSQMALHELTHGVINRLHGNAAGIGSNMSRGMGEGTADFYAAALLSEPADNPLGVHAIGGYATYSVFPGWLDNYYYGLRRFPLAVKASIGPNGLPHNPLTFRYINSDCSTRIGTTTTAVSSAYPRGPIGVLACDQVHNLGEVWAVTLWEVRGQLVALHGGAEGNRRTLQYTTDGMKLAPLNPTLVQSRDAILAAAAVSDQSDVRHIWRGFAIRGLGPGASIQNVGSGSNNTVVTESMSMPAQLRRPAAADFDGDGRTDISVFRPSNGSWWMGRSTAGLRAAAWGIATDQPAAADYDGDGTADIAIFRPETDGAVPDFYVLRSSDSTVAYFSWGLPGDVPAIDDFDGDGKADPTIFRPSTGRFWVLQSSNGAVLNSRPQPSSRPFTGDFDGDGKADFGTFSNGSWLISRSTNNHFTGFVQTWGIDTDALVPGDYDGDGIDDVAVFRQSDGTWYIRKSSGGVSYIPFGIASDVPVQGDYDGDGQCDIAVYRSGVWYVNASTNGSFAVAFGLGSDIALPVARPR